MPALSDRKIEIVRTLVESAPDKIVGGLQRALAQTGAESALAGVRQLVDAEAHDRMLRNVVFQPVVPLCVGDGSDPERFVFPARALALVWHGLKSAVPDQVAAAAEAGAAVASAVATQQRLPDPNKAFDALVLTAAEALRSSDVREFRLAAELCDRARPGGAEALAGCLDISPIVRRAIGRLPDWIAKPPEEVSAAARLAFKDAVAIAPDAGPRFFEMLGAQLSPPWMVLRIISLVMDKPTERYLGDSELGGFAERVMLEIDEALKAIGRLDLDAGPAAGRAAARRVGLITEQTFELEVCMELTRDHGWGKRILDQKRSLAAIVERLFKDAEKQAGAALPLGGGAGAQRFRKTMPKLDEVPEPRVCARTKTLLAFVHESRAFASHGGFTASHAKLMEKLGGMLDHYVEEAVDIARNGMADPKIAYACLMVAADFVGLIRDGKAAELIRRRAAGAKPDEPPRQIAV
ncbi:MAG: hypothetical protein ACJ798_07045 [Phenylobacterium sp.]